MCARQVDKQSLLCRSTLREIGPWAVILLGMLATYLLARLALHSTTHNDTSAIATREPLQLHGLTVSIVAFQPESRHFVLSVPCGSCFDWTQVIEYSNRQGSLPLALVGGSPQSVP